MVMVMCLRSSEGFFMGPVSPGAQAPYGKRNQFRRNPPLRRRDGEEMPLAGHDFELVSAALLEFES
jgi:hypothetical protein